MNQDDDKMLRDAGQDGQEHDDQLWLNTVLEGLGERSNEAKQALMAALMDGQPIAAPVGCASQLLQCVVFKRFSKG